MKQLTAQAILDIGGPKANKAIAVGTVNSLAWLDTYGISQPQRLAHFLSQCGEESDHFKTLREYASGAAYEGRRDLGNTHSGDGRRYPGRGLIETTGRANYRSFTVWTRKQIPDAPDFEAQPQLLETFPWALYSAVWYWVSHDLNKYADEDNIETITHKVNGGLNGFGERLAMLIRASLILLGYGATEVKRFQIDAGLLADGVAGAKTRSALHAKLKALPALEPATVAVHTPPVVPETPDAPAAIRPPAEDIPQKQEPPATTAAAPTTPPPPYQTRPLWLRILISLLGLK